MFEYKFRDKQLLSFDSFLVDPVHSPFLTIPQVSILSVIIKNYIFGRLEPYDESEKYKNHLRIPVSFIINCTGFLKATIDRSFDALCSPIKLYGGEEKRIFKAIHKNNKIYAKIELDTIHFLVGNPNTDEMAGAVFNYFVDRASRWYNDSTLKELFYIDPLDKKEGMNFDDAVVMNFNGRADSLIPLDDQKKTVKENAYTEMILSICREAKQRDIKKPDGKKVFQQHLDKDNNFNSRRKGIDEAAKEIKSIYEGTFIRRYNGFFNEYSFSDVPENKKEVVRKAINEIRLCKGNFDRTKTLIERTVDNYFLALQDGKECSRQVKNSFPSTFHDFICDTRSNPDYAICNFTMFYDPPLNSRIQDSLYIRGFLGESVLDKRYVEKLRVYAEKHVKGYNIPKTEINLWEVLAETLEHAKTKIFKMRNYSATLEIFVDNLLKFALDIYNNYDNNVIGNFKIGSDTVNKALHETELYS
jgi:hypothetical protein